MNFILAVKRLFAASFFAATAGILAATVLGQPARPGLESFLSAAAKKQLLVLKIRIKFVPLSATGGLDERNLLLTMLKPASDSEQVESVRTFYLAPTDRMVISQTESAGQIADTQQLWSKAGKIQLRRETVGRSPTAENVKVDFRTAAMNKLPIANNIGLIPYLAYYSPMELPTLLAASGTPFVIETGESADYSVTPVVGRADTRYLCVNNKTHVLEQVVTVPAKTLTVSAAEGMNGTQEAELKKAYESSPKYILSEQYSFELRDPSELQGLFPQP